MRKRAGIDAALAASLSGMLPTLYDASLVLFSLTILSITILLFSALVLCLHDRFSGAIWTWLVSRANGIEVEYSAAGLGLVSTGLSLLEPRWIILGLILLLAGASLIGIGIGNSFIILKRHVVKNHRNKEVGKQK